MCVCVSVSRGPLWRPHPFNLAPEGSLHLGKAQRPQAGALEVLSHPPLLLGFVVWAGVWPRWGRELESHLGPAWCRPYSCFFQWTLDLDSTPGAGRNLGQAAPGPSYRAPPPTPHTVHQLNLCACAYGTSRQILKPKHEEGRGLGGVERPERKPE